MKRTSWGEKDSQAMERALKMSMLGWMLVLGTMFLQSGEARHLQKSECGPPPKFERRIAHGLDAQQGRHPYMVSLQDKRFAFSRSEHICGGVLVAPNYVLTAAHCIKNSSFPFPAVVIGADRLSIDVGTLLDGGWQRFTTCRTIVHKDYDDGGERENDIALIQISRDSDIFPIALNKEKVDPGREVRALGFGRTENERISDQLQQLDLEILSNQRCIERFEKIRDDCDNCTAPTIGNEVVCAQARKEADVCRGDSGGPIVLTPGGNPDGSPCDDVLVGITSRGYRCDDVLFALKYPGIFTRVSEYISWIENRGARQSEIKVNPEIEDSCFERPEDTEDGRYPYIVSIQRGGSHICEGVLVAGNVVLTAAQCVEKEPFPFVKIGSRYLSKDDPRRITEQIKFPAEEFSVCTTILHEKYKEDPAHYDLALLVMSKDSKHTPISISTERLNNTVEGRVVGWGAKKKKAYYSELRSLDVEITNDGECGNRTTIEVVPPLQSALGVPLIQPQKGRNADNPTKDSLLGIGGKASGCSTGLFSYPRVFIHVAEFASWIRDLGEGQNEKYTKINPDINQCFRFEPTCSFLFKRWIGNNCKGKIGYKPHSP